MFLYIVSMMKQFVI